MSSILPICDIQIFKQEASNFARLESLHWESSLFGVTDGKAVGTYLEHKFQNYLCSNYTHQAGSSASGIDCPALNVDIKVTSVKQPQSSCPFSHAGQKVYGLGYSLLVFVYQKIDDPQRRAANLSILHTVFVDANQTADFQTTLGIRQILQNQGNKDDILGFIEERHLPLDDIGANLLAEQILANPPLQGYLTISNALQWRLQYSRIIEVAGNVQGVHRL